TIVTMKENHRQLLLEKMGRRSGNAIALLENLYFRPIVSIDHVQEITQLSYPNANTLVKNFCYLGLLKEITGQKRNRAFSYAPYLEIFKD
ncbi:MAG: Fic family protein, partial [Microcystis panniformis]